MKEISYCLLFVCSSEVQPEQSASAEEVAASCRENRICLKGIITTPLNYEGGILETLNMRIRWEGNMRSLYYLLAELCRPTGFLF